MTDVWNNLIEGDRGKVADLNNFENECSLYDQKQKKLHISTLVDKVVSHVRSG